jgi:hypothetical protein
MKNAKLANSLAKNEKLYCKKRQENALEIHAYELTDSSNIKLLRAELRDSVGIAF